MPGRQIPKILRVPFVTEYFQKMIFTGQTMILFMSRGYPTCLTKVIFAGTHVRRALEGQATKN